MGLLEPREIDSGNIPRARTCDQNSSVLFGKGIHDLTVCASVTGADPDAVSALHRGFVFSASTRQRAIARACVADRYKILKCLAEVPQQLCAHRHDVELLGVGVETGEDPACFGHLVLSSVCVISLYVLIPYKSNHEMFQ